MPRTADTLPTMLTPSEFAEWFRVPESQIYRLCRLNKLPHVRLGRYVRIPRSAVVAAEECGGDFSQVQSTYSVVKGQAAQSTQ